MCLQQPRFRPKSTCAPFRARTCRHRELVRGDGFVGPPCGNILFSSRVMVHWSTHGWQRALPSYPIPPCEPKVAITVRLMGRLKSRVVKAIVAWADAGPVLLTKLLKCSRFSGASASVVQTLNRQSVGTPLPPDCLTEQAPPTCSMMSGTWFLETYFKTTRKTSTGVRQNMGPWPNSSTACGRRSGLRYTIVGLCSRAHLFVFFGMVRAVGEQRS
jgi:hypothetical protein